MSAHKQSSGNMANDRCQYLKGVGDGDRIKSVIDREKNKWSQIWRYRSNGSLYITWDSRIGDITLD